MNNNPMDAIFEVLRSSTNNEVRKAAAAQLRQLQSAQPDTFLQHTYNGIASAVVKPELRFFLCTLVLAFLGESWHNGVSKESQEHFTALYVQLATSGSLPSVLLARKVGLIVAVMARRGARRAQLGCLPPLVEKVVVHYVAAMETGTQTQAYDRVCYALLYLHLLLKELQCTRVGNVFEAVCQQLVKPLSAVFALLPDAATMLIQYDTSLYLLKCSLRIFGRAVFDAGFCHFLLRTAWGLAEGLGRADEDPVQADHRLRLLEYALKIEEAAAVYFPTRLRDLGPKFFVKEDCANGGLLALLAAVVRSPLDTVVSEKAVCRSMRLFTTLLSAEDGDEFIAGCLAAFCDSATFPSFLQHLVSAYLADVVTVEALESWARQPERAAAELEMDMDDEASPLSCAEQLFLGFTGSTGCAAATLPVAWSVVQALLGAGELAPITAALHAIGVGYYTMTSDDKAAYLGFLEQRLLPLLEASALTSASPFLVRRAVWLIGMWCESVTDTRHRHAVLTALEAVLQHARQSGHVVLILVSLKSTENFISDAHFALTDMPTTLVQTVVGTTEQLLMAVQSPATIKELAGLVHVMVEKGVIADHGEVFVKLFLPPAQSIIRGYETQVVAAAEKAAAHPFGGAGGEEEENEDEGDDTLGSLGMLLECLGSSVRNCHDDDVIWSLYSTLVVRCTMPSSAATAWAEDQAWELLLTMTQSSHTFTGVNAEALQRCVQQHAQRDFAMLPLVFRTVYALLVLRQGSVETAGVGAEQLQMWVQMAHECASAELAGAITAVLTTVARMSSGPARAALAHLAVRALVSSSDVQAEPHTVTLAVALALSVGSVTSAEEHLHLMAQVHADAHSTSTSLLEQLVLLLDVSPSALVSRAIARLLEALGRHWASALTTEESGMVQRAVDGVWAATANETGAHTINVRQDGAAAWGDGEDDAIEPRSPQEMLVEWLGDEDVPTTSPHLSRIIATFAALLL